jgi:hypothetical protein
VALTITHGNWKSTTQDDDLVAASHGDQKARRLFSQRRCKLKSLRVVSHKGEVFGQSDELCATTRRQIDLFLSGRKIAFRVSCAGELKGRSQKVTHVRFLRLANGIGIQPCGYPETARRTPGSACVGTTES